MKGLAAFCILLVITLISVSAYLRLDSSGIGCADWPDCYGLIGNADAVEPTIGSTYERLAAEAQQTMSWATPVHRLIASVLGLAVLALTLISLRQKRNRLASILALGLTVFLAWLGIYSGGLHSPAVVMGNLSGGFALLAVLGWMVFRDATPRAKPSVSLRNWAVAALLLVCVQIGLGGLTSANFAASACQTLPDCHGSYLPGVDWPQAFDLTRTHNIDPTGHVIGGTERTDIHKLHRIVGLVSMLVVLVAASLAFLEKIYAAAVVAIVIVLLEFAVGVAAILTELPIGVAVAHNWLAAMLLLTLVVLLALCSRRRDIVQ